MGIGEKFLQKYPKGPRLALLAMEGPPKIKKNQRGDPWKIKKKLCSKWLNSHSATLHTHTLLRPCLLPKPKTVGRRRSKPPIIQWGPPLQAESCA